MKFLPLAAPEGVKTTISGSANDENFIDISILNLFQYRHR